MFGTREGCLFDAQNGKADITVVCHEARSVDATPTERVFVSVKNLRQREALGEQLATLGAPCQLRAVEVDATLLLRVWATSEEGPPRGGLVAGPGLRACGELRMPLPLLVAQFDGLLYQTWATLDCPGLSDSVASVGADPGSFEQRLAMGARQLFQPRVCLSISRTSECGSGGKLLFVGDAPPEQRAARWSALLRSQQQHSLMSAALHHAAAQASEAKVIDSSSGSSQRTDAQERLSEQRREIDRLRRQLQGGAELPVYQLGDGPGERRPARRSFEGSLLPAPVTELGGHETSSPDMLDSMNRRRRASNSEAVDRRSKNDALRADLRALQAELDKVKEEANSKIDAANERIRGLRKDRDEARGEASRLGAAGSQLGGEIERLRTDIADLNNDKEALLKIVEDLHQTCVSGGLQEVGRRSIDSITANFSLR